MRCLATGEHETLKRVWIGDRDVEIKVEPPRKGETVRGEVVQGLDSIDDGLHCCLTCHSHFEVQREEVYCRREEAGNGLGTSPRRVGGDAEASKLGEEDGPEIGYHFETCCWTRAGALVRGRARFWTSSCRRLINRHWLHASRDERPQDVIIIIVCKLQSCSQELPALVWSDAKPCYGLLMPRACC